ncbi:hypothetical protein QMK19_40175 [Streptomyces sp. H10-C2]|uniref:hypothetical protein n=1 Tax=Streptomyces sp. H10-C2 TaxID=3046210 RepID=UPI0024BA0C77|nr:hypothetical protein [Streptomyces sp. H10-C2]MDJ0375634.1 hypothetical protein [Streptomyces sp. H10-C2]
MGDIAEATWTTHIRGERVEIPATIEGIRATLDAANRAAFDTEIAHTPAQDLHRVLARWALPDAAESADEDVVARLRAGDFSGCVRQDEPRTGVA